MFHISICFITVIAICLYRSFKNAGRYPRPPGPKGLPLVGNMYDLPKPGEIEAHHWAKHKDLYGPISSVTVMGQTMVIINDAQIAIDILEKRSMKYSTRPRRVFAGEMLGWEHSLGLLPHDNRFRNTRKVMGREIGSQSTAANYDKSQEIEAAHFLLRLLDDPAGIMDHIKKSSAGSLALRILYGYIAEPFTDDPLIDLVEKAMDIFAHATVPGAFVVDLIPFLKFVPEWVPGMGFKKLAKKWRPLMTDMNIKPYAFVKHQINQGADETSFTARLIKAGETSPDVISINQWSASALFGGAGDTIVGSMQCFFLAMGMFPEVQQKAQEEIDLQIGHHRLPTVSDRAKLPYIEALVREVLRWHPISPIPLAHVSEEDDLYQGYFIPKGSMMLANVWQFTHNPDVYSDPEAFKPERYLPDDVHRPEPDPRKYVFGFGRRVCPGRILGENALYINIAQTLAVFKISTKDDTTYRFTPGTISRPEPFECIVKPRSPQHESLIRSMEKDYPWEEGHGKVLENVTY
ncbi:cytochrome P450 [Talaromyces proteolyticus]|uniref:Cytochrome P450 n=1 Tax=Talaromyces proteolyticus TaxID=1131652 RepID=A0AAD4KQQ8_9EURO|nr:cytochrome P450 [Talaromyces proteolyticus]KAH8696212.1 cytochrome P450 [Talaromyces proteolyticus]